MDIDISIDGVCSFTFKASARCIFRIVEGTSLNPISGKLPAPTPDQWDFQVLLGRERHTFRVEKRQYSYNSERTEIKEAQFKELTSERWTLEENKRNYGHPQFTAIYRGVYLPSSVADIMLRACTSARPPPSALVDEALQPHVVASILRYALETPLDAVRAALVDKVWAQEVEAWMRKPVVEKIRWYSEDAQQRWWSGLPSALKLQELFTTSDDATALMMLSRAALRPTPSACDLLEKAFRQRDPWHGWANELKFFPFRFKGLADTTFVWCHYMDLMESCVGDCINMLYVLEGSDPDFHLIFSQAHGERTHHNQPQLHLPRFLALRARLRTVFPCLERVPDYKLLALLSHISGTDCSSGADYVASICAFTRLMPGHPERGDGQPTEDEQAIYAIYAEDDEPPLALGADGKDDAEPDGHLDMGWLKIRGLCVLNVPGVPADFSLVGESIEAIDAFHRGT